MPAGSVIGREERKTGDYSCVKVEYLSGSNEPRDLLEYGLQELPVARDGSESKTTKEWMS